MRYSLASLAIAARRLSQKLKTATSSTTRKPASGSPNPFQIA
jgi:hypothetical protein